jgi:hypothetical protein
VPRCIFAIHRIAEKGSSRKLEGYEDINRAGAVRDPGLLPIAALALGVTRGDAAAGGKVGTKGHQRSQEVQYVVPAI